MAPAPAQAAGGAALAVVAACKHELIEQPRHHSIGMVEKYVAGDQVHRVWSSRAEIRVVIATVLQLVMRHLEKLVEAQPEVQRLEGAACHDDWHRVARVQGDHPVV